MGNFWTKFEKRKEKVITLVEKTTFSDLRFRVNTGAA